MGNSQQVEMTPEIKAILDLSKARTLAAKMESQQTERDLAKKVRDEQDAYRIFRFNSSFFIGLSIFKLLNEVFGPKL